MESERRKKGENPVPIFYIGTFEKFWKYPGVVW